MRLASQTQRPPTAAFFLLPSVAITWMSYSADGISFFTDLGFLWMTACCAVFFVSELWHFRSRQGWGAITMYFGILVWFSHDYLAHWFNDGPWLQKYPMAVPVLAKMAFLHCLFITLMAWGLSLKVPDRITRWIHKYPEPKNLDFLFWLAVVTFIVNVGFYALFSYAPNLFIALKALYFGGRHGQIGTSVSFGTSNLTSSMSSYIGMLPGTIILGAHAAAAYLVFSPKNVEKKVLALVIWIHAMLLAYGSGTRSQVVAQGATMGAFLVIQTLMRPHLAKKIWMLILSLGLIMATMIQLQTFFRNETYDINLSDARLTTELEGNTMFSEAMDAYVDIPDHRPFFYNSFPGEGAVRALPEMFFWFAIGPVPRPLLKMIGTDKPIDPAWAYRAENQAYTGAQNMGTTISYGLVGAWYFRFGLIGMMEGAILMGWLYALAERFIRSILANGVKVMRLIISLAILISLLLFYRDFIPAALWPVILTLTGIGFLIRHYLPHDADRT